MYAKNGGGGGGEAGKTAHLRAETSANRVGTVVSEITRNIIASATKHHHSKTHIHTHTTFIQQQRRQWLATATTIKPTTIYTLR